MQLGHRRLALGGAFLNALFKVGRELIQFFQSCPSLILPATASQRRSSQADKRGRMEWSLEKGHVPQDLEEAPRFGIALQPAAAPGQEHKGKVRPFGLSIEPIRERMKIASRNRLFGNDRKSRTGTQKCHQLRNILDDIASQSRFAEDTARHGAVAPLRREYQRPFGNFAIHSAARSNKVGRPSTSSGTPRRTP